MFEKIKELLADRLDVAAEKITVDSNIVKDLGADSIDIIDLLTTLEDDYGIVIPEDEVTELKTVGDIVAIIEKLQ